MQNHPLEGGFCLCLGDGFMKPSSRGWSGLTLVDMKHPHTCTHVYEHMLKGIGVHQGTQMQLHTCMQTFTKGLVYTRDAGVIGWLSHMKFCFMHHSMTGHSDLFLIW